MIDDDRLPLLPGEPALMESVRFRTLGCYPLTGAIRSKANFYDQIIAEMNTSKTSERQAGLLIRMRPGLWKRRNARAIFDVHQGRCRTARTFKAH